MGGHMAVADARFNRAMSYFPTEGKPNDPFDDNFKLVVDIQGTGSVPPNVFGIVVVWKGQAISVGFVEEQIDLPASITFTWIKTPTIAEFLEQMGEKVPKETTTYSYSWVTGFLVNPQRRDEYDPNSDIFRSTDRWDTELLVNVPPFPLDKLLIAAGVGVAALGAISLVSYARR